MREIVFFQNTLIQYLYFVSAILIGVGVLYIFKTIILKWLERLSKKTKTDMDEFIVDLVTKNGVPLFYYGIFYFAVHFLTISLPVSQVIRISGIVLFTIQLIRSVIAILGYALEKFWLKWEKNSEVGRRNLKTILTIAKIVLWGIGLACLLDNLGFKISAVIAGLGIGGVAVALAAQAVLSDLFSYFAIFFDKPFEIGDFIVVDDFLGTIEYVGIKTTRIRSLGGEQIVFSNSNLTNARVRNYKRMDRRRVVFKIGVTYRTSLGDLKGIPVIIKNIIGSMQNVVLDRVHFSAFGDFSLVFEIVYYVLSPDYNKYMDIQQEINFAIKEVFRKRNIEFAYPTQTVYMGK